MTEPEPNISADEREEFELSEFTEWGEIDSSEETKRFWQELARRKLEDIQDVSIGLSHHDLLRLKARADQFGMSYQSLISAVLHRYAMDISRP